MNQFLSDQLLEFIQKNPGKTDREITDALRGKNFPQQPINITARQLVEKGCIKRTPRHDGLLGNYFIKDKTKKALLINSKKPDHDQKLSEDSLKGFLEIWLGKSGWSCEIAWGKNRGIDIEAFREKERWIIEVKGIGSLNPMRVNYFLSILGETLQRMSDPNAKYSIALPDIQQYRNLWDRLPQLAKERTIISALFVSEDGTVTEVK